jgi:hypothetical protein
VQQCSSAEVQRPSLIVIVIAVSVLRIFDYDPDYDNDNEGTRLGTSAAIH